MRWFQMWSTIFSIVRWLLGGAIIIIALAWLLAGSVTLTECIANQDVHIRSPAELYGLANGYRACLVGFIAGHKDEVIATFTVLLAFFTFLLWIATRGLVIGAEGNARRQLRAYVGIDAVTISDIGAGQKPRFEIRVRNFGQTPAYKVSYAIEALVVTSSDDGKLSRRPAWTAEKVVNPGDRQTIHCSMKNPLTHGAADALLEGNQTIVLVGCMRYTDAFRYRRKTKFRQHYKPGEGMVISQKGNKAT